ncbi:MAG: lysylphosphatidylglycerol synthase transmembrane domain-containing protein [Candidatus Hodarchaeales archaeon]
MVIGVSLLLILFYLHWESIIEGLREADYVLVAAAVPFWFLGSFLRATRWRALLNSGEEALIGLPFATRVLIGAFFLESIGPKISSDLYRGTLVWTTSDGRIRFSKSFGVIVFERFLDFFLKLLIAVLGVFLLGEAISELGEGSSAAILFSLFLLLGFAVFLVLLSREEVAKAISEKWVKIAGPKKDSLAGRIDPSELSRLANTFVSLAKSKRDLARSGVLTLGIFAADLLTWIFIFASVDVKPDIFILAFIMSVVTLVVFVSMFPGGYGVREISGSVALVWAGVSLEMAVIAFMALRLFNLLMNIAAGGSFFVLTSMKMGEEDFKTPDAVKNPKSGNQKRPES